MPRVAGLTLQAQTTAAWHGRTTSGKRFSARLLPALCGLLLTASCASPPRAPATFFGLCAAGLGGERVDFDRYRGHVILVANYSLYCGTTPQFEALDEVQRRFGGQGLSVLIFPSDTFSPVHRHDRETLGHACGAKAREGFHIFDPVPVAGPDIHPVFAWLTRSGPEDLRGEVGFNAEKFLVGRDGRIVGRYGPFTSATSARMIGDIEREIVRGVKTP